jgi:hypothetical protein
MIAPLQKAWQWWGGLRLRLVAAQTRSSWKLRIRSLPGKTNHYILNNANKSANTTKLILISGYETA